MFGEGGGLAKVRHYNTTERLYHSLHSYVSAGQRGGGGVRIITTTG